MKRDHLCPFRVILEPAGTVHGRDTVRAAKRFAGDQLRGAGGTARITRRDGTLLATAEVLGSEVVWTDEESK